MRRTWRAVLRAWIVLGLLLAGSAARAQEREAAAKEAYLAGKTAYEAKHFDEALEHFKRSYVLSGQPALLYNISAVLQQLNRPGESADALREFLKARPYDPERVEVEGRIATLQKAQQLIDRDAERRAKLEAEEQARRDREVARQRQTPGPGWLTEVEADRRLELTRAAEHRRKRRLGLLLGIPLGTLVVGGVIAGIVCGLGKCTSAAPRDYDFAPVTVTP